MSSEKGIQIKIRSSIILKELQQLAQTRLHGHDSSGMPGEVKAEPPALELSTHAFRPALASETLSRLSLTPLWRLAVAIALVLLCLVVSYPWSHGALVEYFTIVSHPAAVVILYAAVVTLVSKTDCMCHYSVLHLIWLTFKLRPFICND